MLDRLVKISSLLGIFLVFCGMLKLIVYYSAFNINIIEFLNFTEIITSFLDDINILIIFCVAVVAQTFLPVGIIKKATKLDAPKVFDFLDLIAFQYRRVVRYIFASVIAILFILLKLDKIEFGYGLIYIFYISFLQVGSSLFIYMNSNGKIDIHSRAILMTVLISITFVTLLLAEYDIQKANNFSVSAKLNVEGTIVNCDRESGNIYLGKTDNYVFIFDTKKRTAIVFPSSEVKRIAFPEN